MRRKQIDRIYLILLIILLPQQLVSQDVYKWVYKIRSADNNLLDEEIIQTGFRLKGTKGIITALHGVITGKDLSAKNETTNESFTNLKLTKVDVSRDVALLTSEKLLNQPADGLELGQIDKIKVNEQLYVLGKPLGIETIFSPVSVGNPKEKKIITMIPPKSKDAFLKRGSPGEMTNVIYINGALVPGHSGAPLLDNNNKVLGVVDGGVVGETHGGVLLPDICWAIPVSHIEWKDVSNEQKRLIQLSEINPNELFSFDTEPKILQPWGIYVSGLTAVEGKGFKEFTFHIGAEMYILLYELNFKLGAEGSYIRRYFQTTYSTLPGLESTSMEVEKDLWFLDFYGGFIPFNWEYFNPTIGILVGIPLNVQLLIEVKFVRLNSLTISGQWRGEFYNFETYSIEFNNYGKAVQLDNNEFTFQSFLGLNLILVMD
jgi:hypothetical protein